MASSKSALRSSKSTPSALYSPRMYPVATASVKRPSESVSKVADALATRNGLRYGSTTMLGIRRIFSVTAAQNESAVNGSRASWPPAFSHRSVGAG